MYRRFNRLAFLSLLSLIWVSCDSQVSEFVDGARRSTPGVENSISLASLEIASDRPLITTNQNFSIAAAANPAATIGLTGSLVTGTGSVPGGAGTTPALGGTVPVGSGFTVIQNLAANYDSLQAYTANVSVTKTPSNATTFSSCTFLGMYSGLACVASSTIQFLSTQLLTGSLSVKSGNVTSNSISSLNLKVKQVTNSSTLSAISTVHACGEKFMIMGTGGAMPVASRSFIYDPVADTFRQEFSTRGAGNESPSNPLCHNNRYIYFSSANSMNRQKKFKYDTQTNTLTQVSNTTSNQNNGEAAGNLVEIGGGLYHWNYQVALQLKLMRINTADDSIDQISNLTNDQFSSDTMANWATNIVDAGGGRLFFHNYVGVVGGELYEYNAAGPSIITRANTYTAGSDNVYGVKVFGDSVYFAAQNANNFGKLFRFVLSTNTLYQISNTSQNQNVNDGLVLIGPTPDAFFDGKVYFRSKNSAGGMKLFRYDPSNEVVTQITNTVGAAATSDGVFSTLLAHNGKLYFVAQNTNLKTKLYRLDPVTDKLEQISNTSQDQNVNDDITSLHVYNNRIYFAAKNAQGVAKLMMYDESSHSILVVSNTVQNISNSDGVSSITPGDKYLVFTANYNNVPEVGLFVLCDPGAGCTLP